YQFVTNIVRPNCLTFVATLSQNTPSVRYWPASSKQQADVVTARIANDIGKLIERNNDMQARLKEGAYYLWTDGSIAAYVRFVKDGEKYGYDEQPVMGSQLKQLTPDQHVCAKCGYNEPAQPDGAGGPLTCPECGAPMGADTFQPGVV